MIGRCCAVFPLPADAPDAELVASMVIPLTLAEARDRYANLGYGSFRPPGNVQLVTCRHWDERTRRCGIYDQRPSICRDRALSPETGLCHWDTTGRSCRSARLASRG